MLQHNTGLQLIKISFIVLVEKNQPRKTMFTMFRIIRLSSYLPTSLGGGWYIPKDMCRQADPIACRS